MSRSGEMIVYGFRGSGLEGWQQIEIAGNMDRGLIYPTTRIRKELIFRKLPQFNKILKKVASLTDRINILRYRIESLG